MGAPAPTAIPVARLLVVNTVAVHNLMQYAAAMANTAVPRDTLAMSAAEHVQKVLP